MFVACGPPETGEVVMSFCFVFFIIESVKQNYRQQCLHQSNMGHTKTPMHKILLQCSFRLQNFWQASAAPQRIAKLSVFH